MADEIIIRIKAEGQKQFVEDLKKAGIAVEDTAKKAKKSQGIIGKATKNIGGAIKSFGGILAGAFTAAKLIQFTTQSVQAFKAFDSSLKELQAITGLAGDDLDKLADSSKRLSAESLKSSQEVLEAFKLIGSAKPELLQNVDALEDLTSAAITLSEASGLTLAESATILGNSLNALQLPAEDAGRLINVLASASQKGAKEIPFVAEALSKFGGIASQAGVSVEESVAAVETLGKAIPEASIVGTSLRNVLIELQVSASEQGREFNSLGEELDLLGDKQKDITFLTEKFGDRNLLAVQTLIANRDELENLEAQITATNTAYEQQAIINSSAEAVSKKLANAVNELKVNFGQSIVQGLIPFNKSLTKIITNINDSRSASKRANDEFKTSTATFQRQESALDNLVPRYEKLASQSELTADEQEELRSVTESIAKIVPDAVVAWDNYGNALEVNTDFVTKFREEQNELLQILGKKVIKKATAEFTNQSRVLQQTNAELERYKQLQIDGQTQIVETTKVGGELKVNYIDISTEIARLIQKEKEFTVALAGNADILQENGVVLSDYQQSLIDARDALNGTATIFEATDAQRALIDAYSSALNILPEYTESVLKLAEAWKAQQKAVDFAKGSIEDLEGKLKKANAELKKLDPESKAFETAALRVKALEDELQKVKDKLEEIKKEVIDLKDRNVAIDIELVGVEKNATLLDILIGAFEQLADKAKKATEEQQKFQDTLLEGLELQVEGYEKLKSQVDAVNDAKEKEKALGDSFIDATTASLQNLADTASGLAGGEILQSVQNLQNIFTETSDLEGYQKGLIATAEGLQTLSNFEQAITQTRLKRLEEQRNRGEISEKEFARRRAEILRQEAIFQKAIAISQAIINTALGVSKALPNAVLAGITAAIGAIQVALIIAQPIPELPQFAKGTKGKSLAPPGMKWVGEEGRELIVDNGGYNIITNTDSEQIMKILGGYGVPVQFEKTESELAKPFSTMSVISKRDVEDRLDWNPLLNSNEKSRYSLGRKLDRLHDDFTILNRNVSKRKLNDRI